MRARYYEPYVGRFVSEDSHWGEDVNPLSLNLYTYCSNDPIQFVDPTGHCRQGDDKLSPSDQDNIKELTKKYEKGNAQDKKDVHASAEKIRKNVYGVQQISSYFILLCNNFLSSVSGKIVEDKPSINAVLTEMIRDDKIRQINDGIGQSKLLQCE